MTRWENYLSSAEKIIASYNGSLPLHHFLKSFFKEHPYMGGRDRRWISQLVYQYFRLGYWGKSLPVKEKIITGVFVGETSENDFLKAIRPELNDKANLSLEEKLQLLPLPLDASMLFPWISELSEGIDAKAFAEALLKQPRLFIRVRNDKLQKILALLEKNEVKYEVLNTHTISLPNSTKIETIIPDKGWYEVQDASSQATGELFRPHKNEQWWDACAASGGKSLLLKDEQPDVRLVVSDIRKSILDNLQQRFKTAGIKQYESIVADLTSDKLPALLGKRKFDGIILDAPCSGSGTWGRTPESISFFNRDEIYKFQSLQQQIVKNVIPYLKEGGALIYITCSVFKQENDQMVEYIENISKLRKQEGGVIPGYDRNADTMFAVRMQ
ncbi:RsmB/NOP family class I SAM-dependent RNA methyltransferase [Chitinophaga silvatica]|uniref:RsmB/NOP family class I SAM-dependent RNA methyltransferase n=1 Tax=Chitinophaga silvatica TaxID=2282649 RepID=A0A3E1YDI8_9BACT|nr:RsmB/NOP family class I SAM-dependent RNA methyltransferase [Chitinophaga silvatica]RFS24670.1 RsmB/NOP family class I SAM-dependent RNA methyltransferase [Chitinophaga silvatica]